MGYANQRVFRSVKLGTLLWRWISRNHKITTLHWIITPSLSLTSVCMVSVQLYPTGCSFCSLTERLYFISMLFHLLIELVDPNSQPLLRTAKYVIHALCIVKVYSLGFLHVICTVASFLQMNCQFHNDEVHFAVDCMTMSGLRDVWTMSGLRDGWAMSGLRDVCTIPSVNCSF